MEDTSNHPLVSLEDTAAPSFARPSAGTRLPVERVRSVPDSPSVAISGLGITLRSRPSFTPRGALRSTKPVSRPALENVRHPPGNRDGCDNLPHLLRLAYLRAYAMRFVHSKKAG